MPVIVMNGSKVVTATFTKRPAMDIQHSPYEGLQLGLTGEFTGKYRIETSSDLTNWGTRPLVSFPQKFYCGTYQIELDLSAHPEVAHLRTQWKVSRWGRGAPEPLFGFYLFAQETVGALTAARTA